MILVERREPGVESKRTVILLALDPGPSALDNSAVFPLRPALPLDFLPVTNDCVPPRSGRQLCRFTLRDGHPTQFVAISSRHPTADHSAPGRLQFRTRVNKQRASSCGNHLERLPRTL